MANVIKDLIEDVGVRLGNDRLKLPEDEPKVRRCMNRIYKRLNNRYKLIHRSARISFANLPAGTLFVPVPDDLIEIYWMSPSRIYVQPNVMWGNTDQTGLYTIEEGQIKFSQTIDQSSIIDIRYYSTGRTLVNKEDNLVVAASEVNTPEWRSAFHEILIYETCLELWPEYPKAKVDIPLLNELIRTMATDTWSSQNTTPTIIGGNLGDSTFNGSPMDPFIGQQ